MALQPTTSQPQIPPHIVYQLTTTEIVSSGIPASDVVEAGQDVTFHLVGEVVGALPLVAWMANQPVAIKVHVERVEGPWTARKTFGPWVTTTSAPTPTPAGTKVWFTFTSPALTTVAGGDLPLAPHDDDAVYRVTVEAHFQAVKSDVAFAEGLLMVTAAP